MIRVYLDHDSSETALLQGLRRVGVDVLTTREAANDRQPDDWQLEFAARNVRTIYSANVADFARLHSEWMKSGKHHAGIIVRHNQRMPVNQQLARLANAAHRLQPESMADFFLYLDSYPEG